MVRALSRCWWAVVLRGLGAILSGLVAVVALGRADTPEPPRYTGRHRYTDPAGYGVSETP
jgi:hypothetical protein